MPDFDAIGKKEKKLLYGISIKNFWETPLPVFDALDQEFDFDVDAAALSTSAKCRTWMGLDHPHDDMRDALSRLPWPGERTFLNPPYSPDGGTLTKWVGRAIYEVRRDDSPVDLVVLLLPSSTDTQWVKNLSEEAPDMRFTPRISFIDPDPEGDERTRPMGGSLIVPLYRGIYPDARGPKVIFGYAPWEK